MLYSMNNLLQENQFSSIDSEIIRTVPDYNELMFNTMLETTRLYNESLQRLYIGLTESVDISDFIKSNTFIISAFINNLNELERLFNKQLTTYFRENREELTYIKSSSKELSKLSSNTITLEGYIYTEDKCPNVYIVNEFLDNLVDVIDSDIMKVYENLKASILGGYYDELRQAVLETKSPIAYEDYNKRVYEFYRNDQNDVESVKISSVYLSEFANTLAIEDYLKDVSGLIKQVKDEFSQIIKVLEEFAKNEQIETKGKLLNIMARNTKMGEKTALLGKYDEIEAEKLDDNFNNYLFMILKIKSQQVIKMIEIYGTAISAKINAINESIEQNKSVCLLALEHIEETK